ncbi:pentapeptide repeat-containing protein [Micromonospora sp. NPDC004704]
MRLTAQRILNRHLVNDIGQWDEQDPAWWGRFNVDLAGATLIDFNLSGCHLGAADFSDARFVGLASFRGTHFGGTARFQRASFDQAVFISTVFNGGSNFNLAFFTSFARFDSARFAGGVRFRGTNFTFSRVSFHSARFTGHMEFVATRWPDRSRIDFGMVSLDEDVREDCGDVWVPGWRFDEEENTFVRTSTVEADGDAEHIPNLDGRLRQLRKQARSRHHPRRQLVSPRPPRPRDAPEHRND